MSYKKITNSRAFFLCISFKNGSLWMNLWHFVIGSFGCFSRTTVVLSCHMTSVNVVLPQELSDLYWAGDQHQTVVLPEFPALWLWFHVGWKLQSVADWDQWRASLCPVSNIHVLCFFLVFSRLLTCRFVSCILYNISVFVETDTRHNCFTAAYWKYDLLHFTDISPFST